MIVGLTGVGGGALMTPVLLLFFGTAPLTAIGTDLWFAAITKIAIGGIHQRAGLIDWAIVRRLWVGSLTSAALTLAWMDWEPPTDARIQLLRGGIAIAVCMTAAGLLLQRWLHAAGSRFDDQMSRSLRRWQRAATISAGAALGVLVTMTSVGAGALGVIALLYIYPSRLPAPRLIATDVAHAIPLAMFAGLGHLAVGNVDAGLLRDLLAGSIPAGILGAVLSARLPHGWLRWALAVTLMVIGLKLAYEVFSTPTSLIS